MKRILACGTGLVMMAAIVGCEWQSVDDASAWSDKFSWVNFSGVYRSQSATRAVVDSFSISNSGGSTSTNAVITGPGNTIVIQNESGGTAPALSSVITGQVTATHLPVVPGSLTINFSGGGSGGAFQDDGSGGISGSFFRFPADPPQPGTGSINYNSGSWSLSLGGVQLVSQASIVLSYQYSITNGNTVVPPTTTNNSAPTSGGWIYSLTVQQYGNRLEFTDSSGNKYQGIISQVITPAGDTTGMNDGEVTANYQATGSPGGVDVQMIGAFTGVYVAPKSSGQSGVLGNRTITGTWIEPNGTADILGYAGDQSMPIVYSNTAPVTTTSTLNQGG